MKNMPASPPPVHKRGNNKRLIFVIFVAAAMVAAAIPFLFADAKEGTENNVLGDPGDYNAGDVAVINDIIGRSTLTWTPNDPDSWPTSGVVWSGSTDKRIKELYIPSIGLGGTLDVSGLENLEQLECYQNSLTSLNVSGLTALEYLECYQNSLTSLNVSGLTALEYLYCYKNSLTSLNVSGCSALYRMNCNNNLLTSLDVSGSTALENLMCNKNSLTSLNVSGCSALRSLYCHGNYLTSLDVSGLTALEYLGCYENDLTSLDVSGLTALENLECYKNSLTSLNVSGCSALYNMNCNNNLLTSLDVSGSTALGYLLCNNNGLTSLNVSGCSALYSLYCHSNGLTSLDVSGLTALNYLGCYNNLLTELDTTDLTGCYIECNKNLMEDPSDVTLGTSCTMNFDPQFIIIDINGMGADGIESAIDDAFITGKTPKVIGEGGASGTLSVTIPSNKEVYWSAAYTGGGLVLNGNGNLYVNRGGSLKLTSMETEINNIYIRGSLTVNGNVITGTWLEIQINGILTVNGDVEFKGTNCGIGNSGGIGTIKGNLTDDGTYPSSNSLVQVYQHKAEMTIGGDIVTSGVAVYAWEGNVTVNGSITSGGDHAITCGQYSIVHIKGNVTAVGSGLFGGGGIDIYDRATVKIDGKLLYKDDKSGNEYDRVYSNGQWSVYVGKQTGGGDDGGGSNTLIIAVAAIAAIVVIGVVVYFFVLKRP